MRRKNGGGGRQINRSAGHKNKAGMEDIPSGLIKPPRGCLDKTEKKRTGKKLEGVLHPPHTGCNATA